MEKETKKQKIINLIELVPVRNIKWEKKENGLIVLLKPKFKHTFFKKYIPLRFKSPYYKIKLDAIGSYVWELCNGHLTVKELGQKLKYKFGDDVEPIYNRLALFLQNLEKNHFISYK